jgi:chromosome segregation ATPase
VGVVSDSEKVAGMQLPQLQDKEQEVKEMIWEVSRQLQRLEEQHAVTTAVMASLQADLQALPNIVKLDRNLDTLTDLMNRVDAADTQLDRYRPVGGGGGVF